MEGCTLITLSNGYAFTFCCASGALGFDGNGWWWEQPLRWLGILRPKEFTIIAKTVTFAPRAGNLNMRLPWRCVRLVPGGAVNAVGLSNMGFVRWIEDCYPRAMAKRYDLIASIHPTTTDQAERMAHAMNRLNLKAIEINLSCPNTDDLCNPIDLVAAAHASTTIPLIAKMGMDELDLMPFINRYVECYDLINTVPWPEIFPSIKSPLAKYGLIGGVSGRPIEHHARDSLILAKQLTNRPIISGGGIDSIDEVLFREQLGASAFSLGTVFLRAPWRPNRIVKQYWKRRKG